MCSSSKYPYPHHRWSLEILKGWGISKGKIFKGKCETKLEFLGEKELIRKNHPRGRFGLFIFLELYNVQDTPTLQTEVRSTTTLMPFKAL